MLGVARPNTFVGLRDCPQDAAPRASDHKVSELNRPGLDESGARMEADTERPKSSVFERARERVSMILAE